MYYPIGWESESLIETDLEYESSLGYLSFKKGNKVLWVTFLSRKVTEEIEMVINGLQKMTLLDYPGLCACTVFFAGCNFRCPFCHNAGLVTKIEEAEEIPESEVLSFLEKRRGLLDGVAITGGEPLMQNDIFKFAEKIKNMGFKLKIDTNGSFPDKLEALIESGLVDKIAMDVKNSKEKYLKTIGISNAVLDKVEKSTDILLHADIDYEFRTTVVKEYHEISDIEKIAQWLKGAKAYFLQPFKDSGNLIGSEPLCTPDKDSLEKMLNIAKEYIPNAQIRGNL